MKAKTLCITVAALLASSLQAAVYIEPRASFASANGTPSIGDIGAVQQSDKPGHALGLALGYELSPRVRIEFRYTDHDDYVVRKQSPIWAILPPGPADVVLPALRDYEFKAESSVASIAAPIRLVEFDKLSVHVTPILNFERSKVIIDDLLDIQPAGTTFSSRSRFLSRSDDQFGVSGEINVAYQLGEKAAVSVHYTYSPLDLYDANLFGAGFRWSF